MSLNVLLLPRENLSETKRLQSVIAEALRDIPHRVVEDLSQVALPSKLLIALSLGADGVSDSFSHLLSTLRRDTNLLKGCLAGMVVETENDLYGKSASLQLAFAMNTSGCALVGRPLVEATATIQNFPEDTTPKEEVDHSDLIHEDGTNPLAAYTNAVTLLARRLTGPGFRGKSPLTGRPDLPKMLGVHTAIGEESNAMDLWNELKNRISPFMTCTDLALRPRAVTQCALCSAKLGTDSSCLYGSPFPQEAVSLIKEADALMMICGGHLNSVHAQQLAFIQHLSALFPKKFFYEKALYTVIVSPYSGGDMVASQLISALCLGNAFYLPPKFAMLETASQPNEVLALSGIENRLDWFSHGILETLSLGHFF